MNINFSLSQTKTAMLAIPFFEDELSLEKIKNLGINTIKHLSQLVKSSRFNAKSGELLELNLADEDELAHIILFGLGKINKFSDSILEKSVANVVARIMFNGQQLLTLELSSLVDIDVARAGLAVQLAAYRFDRYRTDLKPHQLPSLESVNIYCKDPVTAKESWLRWSQVADGALLARDLVNTSPNDLTPIQYVEEIRSLSNLGIEIEILDEEIMTDLNMNALLGVAKGSSNPPRLAILSWEGGKQNEQSVLFVGKGVTFDSGGLSLKPKLNMINMKNDMGGSASVVGLMRSLAGRKAKVNVIGIIALVENMPDGNAQRPSDIVTSMSGQTIEIRDTDAEGRLVLADALWYGQQRFNPSLIIDLATLTNIGGILGSERAGIMTNDDQLAQQLGTAGEKSNEPVWRLPIGPEYDYQIESDVADMRNTGKGVMFISTIAGAKFLQQFVNDKPWCHIDIAGTAVAPEEKNPLYPSWATGYGVRLLDQFIAANFENI